MHLLAQYYANEPTQGYPVPMLIWLAVVLVGLVGMWKVFEKAGVPGWAAIIPFYNTYKLIQIVDRPAWWFLMFLIPLVNVVAAIVIYADLAKAFGKSPTFAVFGLILFPFIGIPILGFGSAKYTKPSNQ